MTLFTLHIAIPTLILSYNNFLIKFKLIPKGSTWSKEKPYAKLSQEITVTM